MRERHSLLGECLAQDARKPRCKSERKLGTAMHERRADSSSHPRGRVADFNLGTQQNMEVRMNFHLRLKLAINRGL